MERETLDAALAALAAEFDAAAVNWREMSEIQRREQSQSSMSGEDGIPSHVLSTLRAMGFEYAAKRIRQVTTPPRVPAVSDDAK